MMTKETLNQLDQDVKNAVYVVLSKFHNQTKGIRVQNVQIQRETLNPPGTSYNIRIQAQVTFPTDAVEVPETEEAPK